MCNEFYDTFYGHSEPLDSKWLGDIHKKYRSICKSFGFLLNEILMHIRKMRIESHNHIRNFNG